MKQVQKRERTKQALMDAVKELIHEKGCTNTTLNEIMERSGLSKGAIFHYVESKEELFIWVLQERVEEIDQRFFDAAAQQVKTFEGPMQAIIARLPDLVNPQDIGNQVLMYLLGKSDQPKVKEAVQRFYEQALHRSKLWIVTGQEAGVIPLSIDADKTAGLFMLITFGLRMRGAIAPSGFSFTIDDFAKLMVDMLKSNK